MRGCFTAHSWFSIKIEFFFYFCQKKMVKLVFILGLGGFMGTVERYLTGHWLQQWINSSLPVGTFVVNIAGSLLLGLIYAMADKNQ